MGTGGGLFVCRSARLNPGKFYIGVDANARLLEKVSEKVHRKARNGGLPNALFVQAAVENLPSELDSVAGEVRVHFPWGSLLRGVARADEAVLANLRRVCSAGALLEVVIGLNPHRDRSEMERLGLQPLSTDYIDSVLVPKYISAGFEIVARRTLAPSEWSELNTAWAKRLRADADRTVFYIRARAID